MAFPSHLLVRLPNWVGDVCMSLPSLARLLETGLPVHVCARPWARGLLAGLPLAGFIPMTGRLGDDRRGVREHFSGQGVRTTEVAGLLLPDSLSSAAVFRLAGIRSAGYRDDGRSLLLRWPQAKSRERLHAVESWYRLTRLALQAWQLPAGPAQPKPGLTLPLTPQHQEEAHAALAAAGLHGKDFVLIAPTATGLHRGRVKVWPGFAQLTQDLQAAGRTVLMCPPPAELEEARRNAPTAQVLPPLSLGAFAALTQAASLVVCNDSGVSHVASATGARQVTLFGVTDPARTGPWSQTAICLGADNAWPSAESVLDRVQSELVSDIRS